MIDSLLREGYADGRVAEAMRQIDRALFLPPSQMPSAYLDTPLPLMKGQTISAPGVVALMTKLLEVRGGMKVLEVGAGSGWQAALLGFLAGEKGKVFSIERIPELYEFAKNNLAKTNLRNVQIIFGDGTEGLPRAAPFDRIVVTAAAPQLPPPLLEQLAEQGKLVIPVGGSFFQELTLVEKSKGQLNSRDVLSVVFVPLIGKYGNPFRLQP